jgi:protein-L-isoaspartate(D-aspartate) O-methyltransferase
VQARQRRIMQNTLPGYLESEGVLRSRQITAAFEVIDRVDFVPDESREQAYADRPLPLTEQATISQPTTVAFMLELLQPQAGEKMLDVGAGSGWTTALLIYIADQGGSVVAVEVDPKLVQQGTKNVRKYFPVAEVRQAGELLGAPEEAPFDRILVSAAAEKLPEELLAQLRIGGRIVLPVKTSILKIDRLSEEEFLKEEYPGFVFVPLKT